MKPEFWHGIVEITQVPKVNNGIDKERSWLFDPLGNERVYTTRFKLEPNYFSWKFSLREETKREAYISAYQFLNSLRERFPGLTGEVSVKGITYSSLRKERKLKELVLPRPKFEKGKQLCIVGKIFDIFFFNTDEIIKFYIAWQGDDSISSVLTKNELYKVKIFVETSSKQCSARLEGHLRSLVANIKNFRGDQAFMQEAHPMTWRNILEEQAFYKNLENHYTGIYYKDAIRLGHIKPEFLIPAFVEPQEVDFTIHENTPLKKAMGLQHENIGFGYQTNEESNACKIPLGYYINKNGEITKKVAPLFLNDLAYHVFITGRTGLGKTRHIAHLVHEVAKLAPHIGILVILLRKESDRELFNCDLTLEYPNIEIPYFFSHETLSKAIPSLNWSTIIKLIRENARILTSSVGLTGVFLKNMNTVEKAYYKKHTAPPLFLRDLLKLWYGYFKKYRYSGDFGVASLRAIQNRINDLLVNSDLENVVKVTAKLPIWLEGLKQGKTILLDLRNCDEVAHLLIINLIFQIIKIFIPDIGINKLKYLVVIDEIGEICTEIKFEGFNDDDVISRSQVGEFFSEFLKSFRSRGVGSIFSGHDVVILTRSLYNDPNISMVFALKQDSGRFFTTHLDTQEMISYLGKRKVYYTNSIRNETFSYYTLDFPKHNSNYI